MERRARVTLVSNTRASVSFKYKGLFSEKQRKRERKKIIRILDDALAIEQKGSHFSPAMQKGFWDGRRHMFLKDGCTFPKGLVPRVKRLVREAGYKVMRTRDERTHVHSVVDASKISKNLLVGITFHDHQVRVLEAAIEKGCGLAHAATGSGKCLAPETGVLLYDGTRVRADQVAVGMKLLGPDGTPRTVLSTCDGADEMYSIRANRYGYRFKCNSCHVLTIYDERERAVVDVPLDEFLAWNKDRRRLARMVFSDPVEFEPQFEMAPVDPWLLGLWYADGRKDLSFVEITKPDGEIERALREYADAHEMNLGVYYRTPTNPMWRITTQLGKPNPLLTELREVYGDGRALPSRYLYGSISERRAFLAGIIDGDGSSDGSAVEVTWKCKRWAQQVLSLARSLGFRASIKEKRVRLPGWDVARSYWRVCMTGDTSSLPLRLERKHARSDLRTGFSVNHIGRGKYVGWTLDGDGRFLLGNFIVTHNTEISAAIIKLVGRRSLFLVHTKQLLRQARARIAERLGTIEEKIGVIGDGRFEPKEITVAIMQSLVRVNGAKRKRIVAAYLKTIEVLILDETHHASAKTFYRLVQRIDAPWRFGMSGTPFGNSDGNGLMVEAAFGPVVEKVTNDELISKGLLAKPTIHMIEIDEPELEVDLDWQTVYKEGIVLNEKRNSIIAQRAADFAKRKWPTLILVRELTQGDLIVELLGDLGVRHAFVHGQMPTDEVEKQKARLASGKIRVLVASPIFGEGVDIPSVRALVIADGGQSVANVLQKIGRGLRKKKGDNRVDVVDFVDLGHRWLARHSNERLALYENEKFEVVAE